MSFKLIPFTWEYLKERLLEPFTSMEDVFDFLSYSSGNGYLEFKGFAEMEESFDLLFLFNFIRIQSLRIEEVFPEQVLPFLKTGSMSLTREQILILLCHMTLLTFKSTKRHVYWVNFENWLTDGRPCAQAYLRGLFSYFQYCRDELLHDSKRWKSEIVSFERRKQNFDIFPLPELPVTEPMVHLNGRMGDYSPNLIDFANEFIGFGIGGTQEEILFGSFIELCPSMIFCCDAMLSDEAIVVRNVLKYVEYSGYGFDVKFEKVNNSSKAYNVIALDALDFSADYDQALQLQLRPSNLQRELLKLLVGFSAMRDDTIDTGHWGCGAFGGNKCLKAVLQLIAASFSNNKLSFCCFGDDGFYSEFQSFLTELNRSKTSISSLWDILI